MPIFQYECPSCGHTEEQLDSRPSRYHRCNCGEYLRMLPACANFKIKGYSEANGYARKDNNE